jgi:hypothetical protein
MFRHRIFSERAITSLDCRFRGLETICLRKMA